MRGAVGLLKSAADCHVAANQLVRGDTRSAIRSSTTSTLTRLAGIALISASSFGIVATASAKDAEPNGAPTVLEQPTPEADKAARELFAKMRGILQRAANARSQIDEQDTGSITDTFRQTLGIDAATRADRLLAEAFDVISDAPVTEMREEIQRHRDNIDALEDERIALAEKEIIEGELADGGKLAAEIAKVEGRIDQQKQQIDEVRGRFQEAMNKAGVELSETDADLLLESVTGGDLVAFALAHEAAKRVSEQLRRLVDDSGENLAAARRYYAMHTALIAALIEAYDGFLAAVDEEYLPKLETLIAELRATNEETEQLLRGNPTESQRNILKGNRAAQRTAMEAASAYRDHLERQRSTIAKARAKARGDLAVADNTLRTVDASYQLKILLDNSALNFDALRGMSAPELNRVFENEELKREFQAITEKLGPSS